MQFYANPDADGNITGYYNDDVHAPEQIPKTAIPITEEQWQDAINNPGKYMIDRKKKKLILAPPPPPPTAEQQAASALEEVRAKRRAEYPDISDQLDAIWKLLDPPQGTEAYDMKQFISGVKAKYPKP